MKKILIIEDDGNIYRMIVDELDQSTFEIVRVRSVIEARGAVDEDGPFACFVVDLSIIADGLTLEEMAEYPRREGYAFLKHYLWAGKTENEVKKMKRKTIICSRYVNDFKKEFRNEVEGLQMVLKDYRFEKKISNLVKKILNEE